MGKAKEHDGGEKICRSCGRAFAWRRKWARCWDRVRYCSERCRRHRVGAAERGLEAAILALVGERRRGATVCPSEVARRVRPADWRSWMEPVRAAARRLAARGEVEFTQRGRVVDPSRARGPVRLRARIRSLHHRSPW